jgi:hypothetical protein
MPRRLSSAAAARVDIPASSANTGRNASVRSAAASWLVLASAACRAPDREPWPLRLLMGCFLPGFIYVLTRVSAPQSFPKDTPTIMSSAADRAS